MDRATLKEKFAFVLDEEAIRKIWKELATTFAWVEARAHCKDSVLREFKTVEALLAYENGPERAIVSLEIEGWSEDLKRTGQIRFSDDTVWSTINYESRGDADDIVTLRMRIGEIVRGTKAWYSPAAMIEGWKIVFWLLAINCIWLFVSNVGPDDPTPSLTGKQQVAAILFVIGIFAVGSLLFSLLGKAKKWTFPIAVFCIGQGERSHQSKEYVRKSLMVVFLLSVLASLVATAIVRYMPEGGAG